MKTFKTILKIVGLMVYIILAFLTIAGLISYREHKQPDNIINPKEDTDKKIPFTKKNNAYGKFQNRISNFRRRKACAWRFRQNPAEGFET